MRSRAGLIPGAAVLLVGLTEAIWVYFGAPQWTVTNTGRDAVREVGALLFIPGILLLATHWHASRFPTWRKYTWTLGVVLSVIASVAVLMGLGVVILYSNLIPIDTDPTNYPAMRKGNSSGKIAVMAHFPKEIPREARNVKYRAEPGFLQGGSSCLLQFEAPESYIKSEIARFLPRAKQVYSGGGPWESREIPPPTLYAWPDSALPDDFEVIVIRAEPSKPKNWNHAYSAGIAASVERGTIIYWAEDW